MGRFASGYFGIISDPQPWIFALILMDPDPQVCSEYYTYRYKRSPSPSAPLAAPACRSTTGSPSTAPAQYAMSWSIFGGFFNIITKILALLRCI